MKRLDAIIIASGGAQEVLGQEVREKARLLVEGTPASIPFLDDYFHSGRDARRAEARVRAQEAAFLPLNGPYLQQWLATQGFEVELIPVLAAGEERFKALARRQPRAVIISTTFLPFAAQIDAMAAWVKQHAPGALVIAGGIQVWKSYQHRRLREAGVMTGDIAAAVAEHNFLVDAERPSPVDVLVVSDRGENTLLQLLASCREGRMPRTLANTAWHEQGAWRLNPLVAEPFHEVRMNWRAFLKTPSPSYVPVQAGLGCASRCAFCDFRGLRPVASRHVGSIVEEIRSIPPCDGVRRVFFTDDNLFATAPRAREVCEALVRAKLGVRWRGMLRVSGITESLASLMAESGCLEALLGVESGDPDLLRRMNKRTTLEHILEGITRLGRCCIHTKSTFIIGFPGETESSVRRTVDLINAYPTDLPAAHRTLFFMYAVLPLSGVAQPELRARYGLKGYGFHWQHDTMNSGEAVAAMAWAQDAIKPEISPNYVLEVPEAEGLGVEQIKSVYRLRNLLARSQVGAIPQPDTAALWHDLESCFIH